MNDVDNTQPDTQPVADVPAVADIPPDPNVTPESSATPSGPLSRTDESIHVSADNNTLFYVGSKAAKYKSKPMADMMPVHLYRSTSTFAQPPYAMMRWVVDMFLHTTLTEVGQDYVIVPHAWLRDTPAHLKFEAALELARCAPTYRKYALMAFMAMAASSKTKGAPDITAKANPYAVLLDERVKPYVTADMVCALRTEYPTSAFNTFGRGMHRPASNDAQDLNRSLRVPSYQPPEDCGGLMLDAVRAGVRMWRGPSARKAGGKHDAMVQPTAHPFNPAAPLTDSCIQIATGEGLTNVQGDDTDRYLDIAASLGALIVDDRYASYFHTLLNPPTVDAGQGPQVTYDATYHANVARALARLPRWSWLHSPPSPGDDGVVTAVDMETVTAWEHDTDPKPLTTACSAMLHSMQSVGLFADTVPPETFVDGLPIAKSLLSKVDPLTVAHTGVPAHDYATARARVAKVLADAAAGKAEGGKLLPAHGTVLKATETPESQAEWAAGQTSEENRADLSEVVAEIEYRSRVLREVMMQSAEALVDDKIADVLTSALTTYDPVNVLAAIDQQIFAANQANVERYAPTPPAVAPESAVVGG